MYICASVFTFLSTPSTCFLSVTGCRGEYRHTALRVGGGRLGTRHPVGEAGTDGALDPLGVSCTVEEGPWDSWGLWQTGALCVFSQQLV